MNPNITLAGPLAEQIFRDRQRLEAVQKTHADLGERLAKHPRLTKALGGLATKFVKAAELRQASTKEVNPVQNNRPELSPADRANRADVTLANVDATFNNPDQLIELPAPQVIELTQPALQLEQQQREVAKV